MAVIAEYELDIEEPTEIVTVGRSTLSVIRIVRGVPPDRTESSWQIMDGPADPAYPEDQQVPPDYDAATNNRHLLKVGGR